MNAGDLAGFGELEPAGIFIGDGKLYDRNRKPSDLLRINTILYRLVERQTDISIRVVEPSEGLSVEQTAPMTDTISNG